MEPGGVELPDGVWKRMNDSWIAFFVALGVVNLVVAFNFSRTTWVTFKSFGLTALTIVFALGQGLLIARYLDRIEAEDARARAAARRPRQRETGVSSATRAAIEARLVDRLAPTAIAVVDDSAKHAGHAGAASGGGHYHVRIVSARFAGLAKVARHRLVYDALSDLMRGAIHALAIEALTPDDDAASAATGAR